MYITAAEAKEHTKKSLKENTVRNIVQMFDEIYREANKGFYEYQFVPDGICDLDAIVNTLRDHNYSASIGLHFKEDFKETNNSYPFIDISWK